jgi:hypothetical protein
VGIPKSVDVQGEGVHWRRGSVIRERTVMVYDPKQDSYDTLPPYTCKYFSMAVVNNQLVLVGGRDVQTDKQTNKLGV